MKWCWLIGHYWTLFSSKQLEPGGGTNLYYCHRCLGLTARTFSSNYNQKGGEKHG
jgi:hypothetical protein